MELVNFNEPFSKTHEAKFLFAVSLAPSSWLDPSLGRMMRQRFLHPSWAEFAPNAHTTLVFNARCTLQLKSGRSRRYELIGPIRQRQSGPSLCSIIAEPVADRRGSVVRAFDAAWLAWLSRSLDCVLTLAETKYSTYPNNGELGWLAQQLLYGAPLGTGYRQTQLYDVHANTVALL